MITAGEINARRELAVAVLRAVRQVFAVTVGVRAIKRDSVVLYAPPDLTGKVCGLMHLTGDIPGTVAVVVDDQLARGLSARLAHCDGPDLSEADIRDGVGEIANQVAGRAQTQLAGQGLRLAIGLPSFVGADRQFPSVDANHPCHTLVFECLGRRFSVHLCA